MLYVPLFKGADAVLYHIADRRMLLDEGEALCQQHFQQLYHQQASLPPDQAGSPLPEFTLQWTEGRNGKWEGRCPGLLGTSLQPLADVLYEIRPVYHKEVVTHSPPTLSTATAPPVGAEALR